MRAHRHRRSDWGRGGAHDARALGRAGAPTGVRAAPVGRGGGPGSRDRTCARVVGRERGARGRRGAPQHVPHGAIKIMDSPADIVVVVRLVVDIPVWRRACGAGSVTRGHLVGAIVDELGREEVVAARCGGGRGLV